MSNKSDDEMRNSTGESVGSPHDINLDPKVRADIELADNQALPASQLKQGNPMDKFNTALRKILSVPKKNIK